MERYVHQNQNERSVHSKFSSRHSTVCPGRNQVTGNSRSSWPLNLAPCFSSRADKNWKAAGWVGGVSSRQRRGDRETLLASHGAVFQLTEVAVHLFIHPFYRHLWDHLSYIILYRGQPCEDPNVRKVGIRVYISGDRVPPIGQVLS